MASARATAVRLLKPLLAGIALAYLVTAFVDRPAPVRFQPRGPYVSAQARIVEPQVDLVVEKNIMKLGSPLSAIRDRDVPEENPLARLEVRAVPESNATAAPADPDAAAQDGAPAE